MKPFSSKTKLQAGLYEMQLMDNLVPNYTKNEITRPIKKSF